MESRPGVRIQDNRTTMTGRRKERERERERETLSLRCQSVAVHLLGDEMARVWYSEGSGTGQCNNLHRKQSVNYKLEQTMHVSS